MRVDLSNLHDFFYCEKCGIVLHLHTVKMEQWNNNHVIHKAWCPVCKELIWEENGLNDD